MPLTLNLYCFPNDVFDFLSTEGALLRLDDNNNATGQTITVTGGGTVGGTTVGVTPVQAPLLTGTVLAFDGGGMPSVAQVTLSSVARVGDTKLNVVPLAAAILPQAAAQDSGVNMALAQRLVKGCQYGTSQVKLYCTGRYNDSDLQANAQENGSVNRWATALASRWVGRRCCRPCPKSVLDEADEAMEELKQVRVSMLNIEDVPTRTSGFPFFSNVTIDLAYSVRRVRVEQSISEMTPTQFPQAVDWLSILLVEN